MDLKNIHSILDQLFLDGYQVNAIKFKCETPTDGKITNNLENIYFAFENKLPLAEVNKFITFKLYIEGISFGKNSGVIKLKNFPDMPFNYESKFENFDEEINATFKSQSKRKIASKCLQYAKDWATISSLNGVRFDKCDEFDYFILKNKCYYFVEDQIKNDTELQYGTFISILILGIILPAIIKWAVERIIRSLLT